MGCAQSTQVDQQHGPGDDLPLRCVVTGKVFANYDAAQQHANETLHSQFCAVRGTEPAKQAVPPKLASSSLIPAAASNNGARAGKGGNNATAGHTPSTPAPNSAANAGPSADEMLAELGESPMVSSKTRSP